MTTGLKANSDGSAAIQVGGTDVITLTSGGAATFVTSPTTVQAGTAAAPSITFSGDTDTGIFSPGANTLAFTTNGTEDARFDSAGNFGVGTTSPSPYSTNSRVIHVDGGANAAELKLTNNTSGSSGQNGGLFQMVGNDCYLWNAENSFLSFGTNNTERVRLDNAGNLGLGVTPSAWRSNYKAIQFGGTGALWGAGAGFDFLSSNMYADSADVVRYLVSAPAAYYRINWGNGQHAWFTAASGTAGAQITFTQAMTLDASSNLSVGRSDALDNYRVTFEKGNDKHLILNATTSGNGVYTTLAFANQSTAKAYLYWFSTDSRFYVQNNTLGVYLALNGTAWTSNSDERLKTDLVPISDAMDKVSTLRSVTGRYIDDEEGVSRSFLIAQDVQAVFPQAVDADDPEKLGVRYTDTIPLLVAAIKEQQAMIDELKAKVAALEGA